MGGGFFEDPLGKISEVTGISNPGDLLAPGSRTKDMAGSISGGVGVATGAGSGGGGGGGRGQVETMKNDKGEDWDFSPDADPNQKTPKQAANEKAAAEFERLRAERAATRAQQSAQINTLQRAARGGGPSAARDQLQLASQRNMRAALSMAASGRGNPALASQSAGNQRAIIGQQHASQSGALRAQEMQSAQGQLAQAIQAQRQQDIGMEASVEVARERIASAEKIAGMQVDMNKADPKSDPLGIGMDWNELAALGVSAVTIMAYIASDERLKTDIEEITDGDVDEFFDAFTPKSFRYKHPEDPHQSAGEKVGMMAQDVRDTKLGKKLFSDREDGMSILDPQVLMGIMMAGMKKIMKGQKHVNT